MPTTTKRILLCGVGPVPLGKIDRLYAPGLRLTVFARGLLQAGCVVDMLEVRFGEAESGGGAQIHEVTLADGTGDFPPLTAKSAPLEPGTPATLVARALARSQYSAIVSTTDVMNRACAETCGDTPLWCDFNGHPMAERQGLAHVYDSDNGLAPQWDYLLPALLRADRLSAVSDAQRLALIGELGACGRLNRFTDGYPLATSLPLVPVFAEFCATRRTLRGRIVPEDAFVVLWSGGYNTWADVDTLATGLIDAMRRDPRIHYVSTGGAIAGHDDRTFSHFRGRIDASDIAERCHFVGWVKTEEVAAYYLESDVAISCDRPTLEGELGARNRITDWVCAGLPVITTNLCELTQRLAAPGLIETFAPGDHSALANAFLEAASNTSQWRARASEAREFLLRESTPARLHRDLLDWAKDPKPAPDLAAAARLEGVPFAFPDNPLSRRRAQEYLSASQPAPSSCFLRKLLRPFLGQ